MMQSDMRGVWILMGVATLFALAAFVWVARAIASESSAPAGAAPGRTVHDFTAKTIEGEEVALGGYRGKALLIVNTASRCGFTPQYAGLEKLYKKYRSRGFEILAFPANNFMGQEPGADAEIKQFCELKYKTTFALFSKISVKGADIHPLYRFLTTESGHNGDIGWNFNKFVVAPDGTVRARFGSRQDPLGVELVRAVEAVLPDSGEARPDRSAAQAV